MKKKIFKILKIIGTSFFLIIGMMFLLPILFPGKIAQEVKSFANKKLDGELNFNEANLSFFNHFPSLTLTLTDFSLKGSSPFKKQTLVSADEVSFGIDLSSLVFDSKVNIDKIYVSDALINVLVDKNGQANYNVYKSEEVQVSKDSSTASLRLEKIAIEDSRLTYNDKSSKVFIDAKGFNYAGNGDLDKAIFDIYTEASIESFDFTYDNQQFLKNKKVNADLITKINTNSLSFVFEENNLKINKLPVEFIGKFNFLSNGYAMDFSVKSEDSKLNDFFTALPPEFVTWLDKTKVKGKTDLSLTLKGNYIVSQNKKPDLVFNMKIREGLINYNEAPVSASNIFLNFDTRLPSLDTERLKVNIDSIFFNLDKDYVKAIIKSEGVTTPKIDARIEAKTNLAQLNQTFGFNNMTLKGILNTKFTAKGVYDKKNNKIPVSSGLFSLQNGFVKTDYYPNPIKNINVKATLSDQRGNLEDLKIAISPASFMFEGKPVYVNAKLQNFQNIIYDIKAKGELNLGKIYRVFAVKDIDLEGFVKADVSFKGNQEDALAGNFTKLQNKGTLQLRNIKTKSTYLPKPFIIREGTFVFNQDKMNFQDFKANYGTSDFALNGFMQHVIEFVLTPKGVLKGSFNLESNTLLIDEFMTKPVPEKAASPTTEKKQAAESLEGVVVIPPNLDLQLNAKANNVAFEELKIKNLNGQLGLKRGQMELKNTAFEIIGCTVKSDLIYGTQSQDKAYFDFKILAKDFDIKRAYNEIKLFRDIASAAENAEGIVSLDYNLAGILGADMQPIFPSLRGSGVLSVSKVKMKGFRMFNVVSQKTGKNAIKNPDVTKVDIKSKIKNNIITLERFKFKVAGFRPRIEGTTSFDGKLNIKMRLGLPPLGIIGIPIKITGTQENPKVRLGKQTEDLEETEYEGTVPTPLQNQAP